MKQEEWVKQRLLQQAESMKAEREQLRVQGKVQRDNFREKIERNMQKYKEEILKCESEISQLRFQSERPKIEALKRGIHQMTTDQFLCKDCYVLHLKKGMDECPSCRTPIKERISVHFPYSE
ncbi:hypothetical protein KY285_023657 [Solanum tuberosum]|nr:hypothetical protein KY289_023988 [Solanum tuberosum]KAH0675856.1 hypothetical protein KY285_023657 [Solanum tuberosum]